MTARPGQSGNKCTQLWLTWRAYHVIQSRFEKGVDPGDVRLGCSGFAGFVSRVSVDL